MDTIELLAVGFVVVLSMGGAVAASGGFGSGAVASIAPESPMQSHTSAPTDVDTAVTFDNGTATFTVTNATGAGVENLTVSANDETVGTTDANGTVSFDVANVTDEDADELTIAFEGPTVEGELAYERHDGQLLLVEEEIEYERPDAETEQEGDENEDDDPASEDDEDEVKDEKEDDDSEG